MYKSEMSVLSRIGIECLSVFMLSSGTIKVVILYIFVVVTLENGFDFLIDEVKKICCFNVILFLNWNI